MYIAIYKVAYLYKNIYKIIYKKVLTSFIRSFILNTSKAIKHITNLINQKVKYYDYYHKDRNAKRS